MLSRRSLAGIALCLLTASAGIYYAFFACYLLLAAGSLLERRTSRRGLLARAALAGSAMAVAPLRYLLRPVSAWAVIHPHLCGSGLCADGYTAFCCEINEGKNVCPSGTFIGGWWKCTRYTGSGRIGIQFKTSTIDNFGGGTI